MKPVFSDLFVFRSGRRDRRSFGLLVLTCLAVEFAIVAWIFVPALLAWRRYLAMVASGQPLPDPGTVSGLSLAVGLLIGMLRVIALMAAIVMIWSAATQRCRDLGWRGRSALWLLVPVVNVYILFVLFVRKGQPGENRFGPDPRGDSSQVGRPM